ncbi:hypothetical protein CDG24_25275 [Salmonella enterica subsp. enterica serovar Newport]|nr:hypothetical protein [Salmonella enterica subsp. enterica serovar Newport]
MSKSTVVGGGIAVAAVVAVKFIVKAGVIAAIFGGTHVAANAYQSSVMHVKSMAQDFNARNKDEQIFIDEANKALVHHVYMQDVSDDAAANADPSYMAPYVQEAKAEQVKHLRQMQSTEADLDLINHGWSEVYKYETLNHVEIASFTISQADL